MHHLLLTGWFWSRAMRSSIRGNSLMGCSQAERALAKLEGGAAMSLKPLWRGSKVKDHWSIGEVWAGKSCSCMPAMKALGLQGGKWGDQRGCTTITWTQIHQYAAWCCPGGSGVGSCIYPGRPSHSLHAKHHFGSSWNRHGPGPVLSSRPAMKTMCKLCRYIVFLLVFIHITTA